MPTFNCGNYISASIRSILLQTFENFELIIIDDGSTDNTADVVDKFDDKRIIYKKIKHSGISIALNYGLEMSRFDWIARMDADDISLPHRLKIQAEFLDNHQEYSVLSSWYALFSAKKISHLFKLPEFNDEIIKGLKLHSTLCHAASFAKKKVITDIGGYNNIPFEDYDIWLRLKDKELFYNIPEVLVLVRSRKESLLKKSTALNNQIPFLQRRYFINKDRMEIDYKLEGWREWFYGDKSIARMFWFKQLNIIIFDFRILLAIVLSFFPSKYFEYIKKLNLKARVHYLLSLSKMDKERLNAIIANQFRFD